MAHPQCPAAQGYHIGQGIPPRYSATYGLPQTGAAMQGQQRQPVQHPAPGAIAGQSSAQRPPYQPPRPQAAPPGTQALAPTPTHPLGYTQSTELQAPHDAPPTGLYNSLYAAKPPTSLPTGTAVVATADMARLVSMTSKTGAAGSYVSTTPCNLSLGPSQDAFRASTSLNLLPQKRKEYAHSRPSSPPYGSSTSLQNASGEPRGEHGTENLRELFYADDTSVAPKPRRTASVQRLWVYYKLHKTARPLNLKTDVITKRNRDHSKNNSRTAPRTATRKNPILVIKPTPAAAQATTPPIAAPQTMAGSAYRRLSLKTDVTWNAARADNSSPEPSAPRNSFPLIIDNGTKRHADLRGRLFPFELLTSNLAATGSEKRYREAPRVRSAG
ncbi:hypothetical protein GGTG_12163 [Gaeumannomyces tritici R3-111a-1]|uniref:Uncharacterized protein n=1 Tax=Gaeumannomyces tritici (strain R3-111a-1) TaxID=644352 RepID=J3PF84_GAET3|nr:hypothetical protein GGTG_12163 [Gaeumannomyces tritici R3-111a-1]EJT69986.1 hypothetical protein GGTG_12163 [Gaeumannomyces tritici R3-111a-1]